MAGRAARAHVICQPPNALSRRDIASVLTLPTPNILLDSHMAKKTKCALSVCQDRAVAILGDCKYCEARYCSKHRLPEMHACANIQQCKNEAVQKLSQQLLADKCVPTKLVK
jgi:predicted nucleic acid binding AN1-type Zn finger protein